MSELGPRAPRACGWGLAAASALLDGPVEIAVVGDFEDPATSALRAVALAATAPGAVIAVGEPGSDVPLLRDRSLVNGSAAAYVCRGLACLAPVIEPFVLASQVGARSGE